MAGILDFSYSAPDISEDGDVASWSWTLTNTGDAPVTDAVFDSTVTPALELRAVGRIGDPEARPGSVRVRFATVAPGEKLSGGLDVDLPEGGNGSVSIKGRVNWKEKAGSASADASPASA